MNYQRSLDLIFESFIAAKPFIAGKLDRDVRDPNLLLNIARAQNLVPAAHKVIKITGSKGKGTVARLTAHALCKDHRVGLITSPEEISHLDRLRINGQPISEAEFVKCFEIVWQMTSDLRANLFPPAYLSPYGLFLLIAFVWFKSHNVEAFVIETGRGVKFDEGGQIPAKVGVVTSVFKEHASYLGPSLEEIRSDKHSIADNCKHLILGKKKDRLGDKPSWYLECQITAQRCVEAFLGRTIDLPNTDCASFGHKVDEQGRQWFYEGLIAKESCDVGFLQRLVDEHDGEVLFLISLPDDKDIEGVCSIIHEIGGCSRHIIMTGDRGFLSYETARQKNVIYEGPYDAPSDFSMGLDVEGAKVVYFLGTQTYLRLIKQAFFS